jgi:hypothetical protein
MLAKNTKPSLAIKEHKLVPTILTSPETITQRSSVSIGIQSPSSKLIMSFRDTKDDMNSMLGLKLLEYEIACCVCCEFCDD